MRPAPLSQEGRPRARVTGNCGHGSARAARGAPPGTVTSWRRGPRATAGQGVARGPRRRVTEGPRRHHASLAAGWDRSWDRCWDRLPPSETRLGRELGQMGRIERGEVSPLETDPCTPLRGDPCTNLSHLSQCRRQADPTCPNLSHNLSHPSHDLSQDRRPARRPVAPVSKCCGPPLNARGSCGTPAGHGGPGGSSLGPGRGVIPPPGPTAGPVFRLQPPASRSQRTPSASGIVLDEHLCSSVC